MRSEFKLPLIVIFGRHLFEFELRQRVAVGDFVAAIAGIKNDEVLVRRRIQLVLFLDLFGLARVAHIIHRADGNFRVDRAILVEQRNDVRVKIVLPVVIKRHGDVIRQRVQHAHGARGEFNARLRTQVKTVEELRAEVVHHHHDRKHQGRAHDRVKADFPPVTRRKTGLAW